MYKYTGKHIKQIRVNDQNVEKNGKQLGLINYQDFDKSQGSFFFISIQYTRNYFTDNNDTRTIVFICWDIKFFKNKMFTFMFYILVIVTYWGS